MQDTLRRLVGAMAIAALGVTACRDGVTTPQLEGPRLEGPRIEVRVGDDRFTFEPGSPRVTTEALPGYTVRASASPGPDGAPVVSQRWGMDVRDSGDDEEWEQNWCEACAAPPVRDFATSHTFFYQARDAAGRITLAELEVRVPAVVPTAPGR